MGPTANVGTAPNGRRCLWSTQPVTAFGGLSPPSSTRLALPGFTPGLADVDGPVEFARVPQGSCARPRPSVGDSRTFTGVAVTNRPQPGFHRRAVVFPNPACAWSGSWPCSATAAAATHWTSSVLLRDLGLHILPDVSASAPIPDHLDCRRSDPERSYAPSSAVGTSTLERLDNKTFVRYRLSDLVAGARRSGAGD